MKQVKIIIENGVVQNVIGNVNDINVEVIDINNDYEDYEQLVEYKGNVERNEELHHVPYTVASFESM